MLTPSAPEFASAAAAALRGLLLGAGLIMAIGAQNALVLRQGLLRRHVAAVVAVCALSDVLLIHAGVFGLGGWIARSPGLLEAFRVGGGVFLLGYALRAAWRAWQGGAGLAGAGQGGTRMAVLGTALALTWLNPHVYLDTVVLLGSVGAQQPSPHRPAFALGASAASALWFSLIGFGAARLAPRLQGPRFWRALDVGVAAVMAALGVQLLLQPTF